MAELRCRPEPYPLYCPLHARGRRHPKETRRSRPEPRGHSVFRHRRHGRHAARLPGVGAVDGDSPSRDERRGNGVADRRDGAFRRAGRPVRRPRHQGRQAQHRRRRRQDIARAGAARGGVRRVDPDDVRTRPGAHRRDARQARIDSGIPRQPLAPRDEGGARAGRLRDDRADRRGRAGGQEALRAAGCHRDHREHPAHQRIDHEQEDRRRDRRAGSRRENRQRRVHEDGSRFAAPRRVAGVARQRLGREDGSDHHADGRARSAARLGTRSKSSSASRC